MANKIVLKKSSVAAKVPVAGDLDFGELAINYTDGKLYFKKADNTIDAFTTAAASAPVTSVGGNIGDITDAQLLASIKNVDGTGSGLDADTLDGNHASAFYLASNPNGYTSNTGTVTSVGATAPLVSSGGTDPSISIPAANSTTNGYMSSAYAAKLDGIAAGATNVTNTNQLVNGAGYITSSGSITGSAGSVSGLTLTNSSNGINPDNVTQNQLGYNTSVSLFGQTDGGLYSSAYSSSWIHQIYGDFRTGQIAIRGKNSGTWQAWRTVLDSSNYTSYTMARDAWNGNLYFNNDGRIYATIMYDSNNSAYYCDPSSTSNLSAVNVADSLVRLQKTHTEGGEIRLLNTAGTAGGFIQGWDSGIRTVDHNWTTTTWSIDNSGNSIATASHRAPIFYDSNDTGYYIDPSSTSNSAQRMRGGTLYGPNPTWGAYLYVGTDGRVGTSATVAVTNGNLHLDAQDGYDIYLNHYNGRWTRTPGMYDNNDTGYYLDPNDTSRLNYLRPNRISIVGNQDNGYPRWDFKAYVVESQHHYAQTSTQSMYIGEDNYIYMRTHTEASGSHRAPIFYDSNNTGYYADLNNTTYLYYLQSATTVRADSDRRLKDNIKPIENALEKVRKLQGCTYTRKDMVDKTKVYMGMIAQDVLPIVPEVVGGSEEGKYSLGYAEMVPLLNEAIKEQDLIIIQQEARIAKLEALVNKLIG